MSVPRASAFDRRGIWFRNSNFSKMSWTFGENPFEIRFEIRFELLLTGPRFEVPQGEVGGVVECLSGSLSQSLILMVDLGGVELCLQLQNGRLARFQDGIEPPKHSHG